MPAASPLTKLMSLAEKFVVQHDGQWTHEEWELLVEDARSLGYPFDQDECKRNLGNILESAKYFYSMESEAGGAGARAKKRAPARKKAAGSEQ